MNYPEVLSTIALIVSVGSFGLAATNIFRDRPRVKITSALFEGSEYDPEPSIHIVVINKGRRPVILRMLGGSAADDDWSGEFLEYDKGGVRLGEHERWEHSVSKQGRTSMNPDGPDIIYTRMWIEDSLGNRYLIPHSREHIARLRG
jgi:hypothetical protein